MASSSINHHKYCNNTVAFLPPRKVRVVAKIRGSTGYEADFPNGDSWISVKKPNGEDSQTITLSFGDKSASRKESYELDFCYEQNKENDVIFSREVKPLISGVFEGFNATVIAHGARGSGKTFLIQGSTEKTGLAELALAEILSMAEENGCSVAISSYEVYHERVSDLLDSKQQAVFVLEDGHGKIQLKGLSRVPVKSILEFQKLIFSGFSLQKPANKIAKEPPRRVHRGLIVYVSSPIGSQDNLLEGKINFVDMAGYEDARKKSIDGLNLIENSKINKSIYAVLNVVHALAANESRVPFRESKLTRILQDSLGGAGRVLMLTCLNPSYCQDSINMVNMASRCCQQVNPHVLDSTKKTKSLTRSVVSSDKFQIPRTVYDTAKKQTNTKVPLSEKKTNGHVSSALKGRKLFGEAKHSTKSEKASSISDPVNFQTIVEDEEKPVLNVTKAIVASGDNVLSNSVNEAEPTSLLEKENGSLESMKDSESSTSIVVKDIYVHGEDRLENVIPSVNGTQAVSFSMEEDEEMEKENKSEIFSKDDSPPLSTQIQKISNSLRAALSDKIPEENNKTSYAIVPYDIVEPKTPVIEQSMRINDRHKVANIASSPWETFSTRNSGMKESLVQEYIKFLNTADKEELKKLKGIGEKRATYILELREESPIPFKSLDDLKEIGLSTKQIKGAMKKELGSLFN